ncbi:hypothetical protein [uncultured Shewanella sp.]|uniref:helix-turn-helix transcriptional regulator n=1 Tax=uncultured Shewanella sp. TaxID=173975 RepID=UPI002633BF39|nr:hypothetical protein [uncultured Shewanella sp.]
MNNNIDWIYLHNGKSIQVTTITPIHSFTNEVDLKNMYSISTSDPEALNSARYILAKNNVINSKSINIPVRMRNKHIALFCLHPQHSNTITGILILYSTQRYEANDIDITLRRVISTIQEKEKQNINNKGINSKTQAIIKLTALGMSSKDIAKLIGLSTRGVQYHLEIAKNILGAKNNPNLILEAINNNLI